MMTHVGCGGEVKEDWSKTYAYEGCAVPAFRCVKCGNEILGDKEIHLPGFDEIFGSPNA